MVNPIRVAPSIVALDLPVTMRWRKVTKPMGAITELALVAVLTSARWMI
jgi:hypothetical protein